MTLSQLKTKYRGAIPNQVYSKWEATDPLRRSRNRWRLATAAFFMLFMVESCAPEPTQSQHPTEQTA